MSKTKYFVVYRLKETVRGLGESGQKWRSYSTEAETRKNYDKLKGLVSYRALSYGLGCVLEEKGRAP